MPAYPGFVGPAYIGFTPNAAADECINLIPEPIESGTGQNKFILAGTPGTAIFGTLPYYPILGMWGGDGRLFAVAVNPGNTAQAALFEISPGQASRRHITSH